MGYKYFKDKRYLASARKTAEYLEKELISKADYFLLHWMQTVKIKKRRYIQLLLRIISH